MSRISSCEQSGETGGGSYCGLPIKWCVTYNKLTSLPWYGWYEESGAEFGLQIDLVNEDGKLVFMLEMVESPPNSLHAESIQNLVCETQN